MSQRSTRPAVLSVAALLILTASPAAAYLRPGTTAPLAACLRECSSGGDPNHAAVSFDATGRYLAFSNVKPVSGKQNVTGARDAFVWDRVRQRTELVSQPSTGVPAIYPPGSEGSINPHLSADGRFVAFMSDAINLVPGDTNLAPDIFVHDRRHGIMTRVSVSSSDEEAGMFLGRTNRSEGAAMSGNGRYVAFASTASNLVENDTNGVEDVFVHDLETRRTERVSLTSDGSQADPSPTGSETGMGAGPSISFDGRYVAFRSWSPNLVDGVTNLSAHVYLRDRKAGKTERVSVNSQEEETDWGAGTSWVGPHGISADGRYVLFTSGSNNVVPNDRNLTVVALFSAIDVFVRDRKTGRTERLSVSSAGEEATGDSGSRTAGITPSRRHVFFTSTANDLTPGDGGGSGIPPQPGDRDAFVHDIVTGSTEIVSVDADGRPSPECFPRHICASARGLSHDGRIAVFESTNRMVPNESKADLVWSLYLRHRGPVLGALGSSPPGSGGSEGEDDRICIEGVCIPPQGAIAFEDRSRDVRERFLKRGADLIGGRLAYRPHLGDIFVSLELDHMATTPLLAAATAGVVYGLAFEIDGHPYEVRAVSTGLGSRGETRADFGLFSCPEDGPLCRQVATLRGGFGTTGERITFSLPLEDVGARMGSTFSKIEAYTGTSTSILTGLVGVIDRASF